MSGEGYVHVEAPVRMIAMIFMNGLIPISKVLEANCPIMIGPPIDLAETLF